MRNGDIQVGAPETLYADTQANLAALTGVPAGSIAYATDIATFGYYNGSSWVWGGAAQVNSDWNAVAGIAQILNKPSIPAAQVQSDWNEATNTHPDYIKNKPTIPVITIGVDMKPAVDFEILPGYGYVVPGPFAPTGTITIDLGAILEIV